MFASTDLQMSRTSLGMGELFTFLHTLTCLDHLGFSPQLSHFGTDSYPDLFAAPICDNSIILLTQTTQSINDRQNHISRIIPNATPLWGLAFGVHACTSSMSKFSPPKEFTCIKFISYLRLENNRKCGKKLLHALHT